MDSDPPLLYRKQRRGASQRWELEEQGIQERVSVGATWDEPGSLPASVVPSACLTRRLRRLGNELVDTEDGPHPMVKCWSNVPPCAPSRPRGRATSVPFTAVTTGPQRTPTDNHTVAATCTVHHLPR
jgi:hypothetical protein